jgi:hypothetical protein
MFICGGISRCNARTALSTLIVLLHVVFAASYPGFQNNVPNGAVVPDHPGLGHVSKSGSGKRNAFGQDFFAAGKEWTKELCEGDSDGDGQSNGLELGDPCCSWTKGDPPLRTNDISDPSLAESTTTATGCPSSEPEVQDVTEAETTPEIVATPEAEAAPVAEPTPSNLETEKPRPIPLAKDVPAAGGVARKVEYTGYIVDVLCYNNQINLVRGPNTVAPDGSDVTKNPQDHTKGCLLIKVCADSGFVLLEKKGDVYVDKYLLDEAGNREFLRQLRASAISKDIKVKATGVDDGTGVIREASIELVQPATAKPAPELAPPAANPVLAPEAIQTIKGYDHSYKISGELAVYWSLVGSAGVKYAISSSLGGWLALGWGEQMIGSLCVMANLDGAVQPQVYKLEGYSADKVKPSSKMTISDARFESRGGLNWMHFKVGDGRRSSHSAASGATKFIAASSPNTAKQYHGPTRKLFSVDLETAAQGCSARETVTGDYVTHGVLMFVGWGLLIPVGMISARYLKPMLGNDVKLAGKPLWFQLHLFCQVIGVVVMTAGFILAHASFKEGSWTAAKAHCILGNLAFAFGILQPINAFFRPHPPEGGWGSEGVPKSRQMWELLHKNLGRVVALMAMINIFLGLDRLGTIEADGVETVDACPSKDAQIGLFTEPKAALIAYDVWFIIVLVAFIILEIKMHCQGTATQPNAQSAVEMKPGAK